MTEPETILIKLPWPDKQYLPNKLNKQHWGKKSRLVAAARFEAAMDARSQVKCPLKHDGEIRVNYLFTPPKRRGPIPDEDGMIGMMKHFQDGVADAIGIDDRHWRTSHNFSARDGSGKVILEITPQNSKHQPDLKRVDRNESKFQTIL